ncbi:MAG: aminoacyl-tRNA hydrolase [Clostridia bacterium]|nr:aminoacyl-tRNA hydrolase [Clostridia bacterium]
MYLIVGLGNPGREYEMTRHNIGFEVIDYMADQYNIKVNKLKFKALYGEGSIAGEKVYFVKPQTYMNLSGESIREFCAFYKIQPENVIVIYDDVSLEAGRLRLRAKGSDGGHNGIKSIIYQLKSDGFPRIKIGIGSPLHKDYNLADFVLGKFTKEEIPVMEEAIRRALQAAEEIIRSGMSIAMNRFNGK